MRWLALVAALLGAGCACPALIDLGKAYPPLEKIVNDRSDPGVFHAYVTELRGPTCDFLAQDEAQREALLLQEQLMAQRQRDYPGGLPAWLDRCKRDPRFLVSNELDGWDVKIHYLVQHGEKVDKLGTAKFLSDHYGPTLDPTSAVVFVEGAISASTARRARADRTGRARSSGRRENAAAARAASSGRAVPRAGGRVSCSTP